MLKLPALFLLTVLVLFSLTHCRTKKTVDNQIVKPDDEQTVYDPSPDKPRVVPAYPDTIEYIVPDGYKLLIFLRGDEFSHYVKTVDGVYLLMNDDGFYEYAFYNEDNVLESTGIIAKNAADRTIEENQLIKTLKKQNR